MLVLIRATSSVVQNVGQSKNTHTLIVLSADIVNGGLAADLAKISKRVHHSWTLTNMPFKSRPSWPDSPLPRTDFIRKRRNGGFSMTGLEIKHTNKSKTKTTQNFTNHIIGMAQKWNPEPAVWGASPGERIVVDMLHSTNLPPYHPSELVCWHLLSSVVLIYTWLNTRDCVNSGSKTANKVWPKPGRILWYGFTRCHSWFSLKTQKMWPDRNMQYDLIDSRQHDALWVFAIMNHTCKVEPQLWNISCLSSYTVFRLTKDRANIWSNTEFIHGTMKTKHCRLGPCLSEEAILYQTSSKEKGQWESWPV